MASTGHAPYRREPTVLDLERLAFCVVVLVAAGFTFLAVTADWAAYRFSTVHPHDGHFALAVAAVTVPGPPASPGAVLL